MSKDELLFAIKDIIVDHQGKDNQISADEIGPMVGIYEDATHVQTRASILKTIEKFKLPVAASSRGYYLIKDEKELEEYMSRIDNRIFEMENRKTLVEAAFRDYY